MINLTKRLAIFILSLLLFFQFIPTKRIDASPRVGVGEVNVDYDIYRLFQQTKELDISETDIEMIVTDQDRERLYQEAKESAFKWYYLTVALQCEKLNVEANEDGEIPWEDLIKAYEEQKINHGLHQKYWYENLELEDIELNDFSLIDYLVYKDISSIDYIDKLVALGDVDTLLNSLSEDDEIVPALLSRPYDDGYDDGYVEDEKALIRGKIEEIYNDKLSDLVVGLISENINTNVEFSLIPLASDGSQDEEFMIEGNVKRGVLHNKESLQFNLDFGNKDQIYDTILEDAINNYDPLNDDRPDDSFYQVDDYLLKDNRTFIEHVMFIDGGYLKSSDGSQTSHTYLRGNENYPGYHSLLTIADGLITYAWARYGYTNFSYVQTFNLHLNPAVAYLASYGDGNLISHVEFDGNGKITSIKKPIVLSDEVIEEILKANQESGVYRFKLVESNITGDDSIAIDEKVRFIDVVIKQGYNFDIDESDDNNRKLRPILCLYYVSELDNLSNANNAAPSYNTIEPYEHIGRNSNFCWLSDKQFAQFLSSVEVNIVNKSADLDIEVTKNWQDHSDEDGIRPDLDEFKQMVKLYIDNEESDKLPTYVKEDDDTYILKFENLPKYKYQDNQLIEIEYDVKELEIEGYTSSITGNAKDGFVITNYHKPKDYVDFTVYKSDARDNAIFNATMALYDENDNELDKWLTDGKDHELSVKPGKYTLKEVEAPIGFAVHEPIEFEVMEDGSILLEETKNVKLKDNKITVKDPRSILGAHQMEFDKVDENGNLLKGATIRIYDDNGNIFDEWVSDKNSHVCPLQPNTYWFLEVEAPHGYKKIEKFAFEVDEDGYFRIVDKVAQVKTTNTNMKIINKLEPRFKTPYDIPNTGIK